ncbi:MAG: tripartite tricarboxylate transporter substrate binding protein [Betaproteobacteria bacterium]|nr:tripartite tricarboxylate transporter substrate binding protein [Betaproteobacteria bacterium]
MVARIVLLALCSLATMLAKTPAYAQAGAEKVIKLIVPFGPGGGTDILGRIIAPKLAERLGQPVVVENRPGAGGSIGARFTAQSAPDGLTVMIGSISEIGINPSVNPKVGYDVWRDFSAVTPLASSPMILVAHPSVPVKTVKELIALAQARPGHINYGSAGGGSGAHMAAELFRYLAKVDLTHIPYKGVGPAVADLVGGQVQLVFTTLPSAVSFVKGGQLKAIAMASTQRAPALPEVPTFVESGLPAYVMEYWYGFFVPIATPKEMQTRLEATAREVLRLPDVLASFDKTGLVPMSGTPQEFATFVKNDMERWAAVVKSAGIKVE